MTKQLLKSLDKYWVVLLLLLFITQTQAQTNVDINCYSNGYVSVYTYNGVRVANHSKIQINLRGSSNLQNWTLSARVTNPIRNSDGKIFPADKVSLKINHIEGHIQGVSPTITTIGANPNPIPLQQSEVNLIQNSPLKLVSPSGTYNQLVVFYDLAIAGGAYLQNLKSDQNQYYFNTEITLRDGTGKIVSQSVITNYQLHVIPTDSPPIENTYGIEVNTAAKNSLLNVKTLADYIHGAQIQYDNALKVISSTPYSIQVRSTSSHLTANRSELPIDIIKLSLIESTGASNARTVNLSTAYQTIYQSNSPATTAKYFHLKYATPSNDQRLLEVETTTYTTTLIYTLTPQ